MGFAEAVKVGISKFFSPYGRSSRSEFWWWYIFTLIITCFFGIWGGFVSGRQVENWTLGVIMDVIGFVFGVSMWCAEIRRLHDTGRSGWNTCWAFIPLVGWIYVLYLLCQPTQPGANRYGDQPQ